MKLKTAAKIQWGLLILLAIIKLPLTFLVKVITFIDDNINAITVWIVYRVGNNLLLNTKEFKSGIYKNPEVKKLTAIQVWKHYNGQ